MPDLYHGPYGDFKQPLLYAPGMRRIEGKAFDSFKLEGLAPRSELDHLCNIWHWEDKKHTLMAWHDHSKHEAQVFIPALLDQREALEYARTKYPEVMPSPITFRFCQGYYEVLVYD